MKVIQNVGRRMRQFLHERMMRASCVAHASARFQLSARVRNNSSSKQSISIGASSVVGGELLVFGDGGRITIGESCYIGEGARIWSAEEITIGDRVLISHNVNIHDSAAHSLSAAARHEHFQMIFESKLLHLPQVAKDKVIIEDDVWIGFNASLMRGIRVGRGAIVAAGAIVTRDVDPFSIVAGPIAAAIGTASP